MVMWTEFHPPTAPVTRPRLQPHPNSVCTPRSSRRSGLARIFKEFFIPPSCSHSSTLCIHKQTRARASPSGVKELFNAHARPHTDTNRPQETAGDVGLLALSCCLQVKFAKSKWPVCFSLIGKLCWALEDVCWGAAEMTERCMKSFVSRGVQERWHCWNDSCDAAGIYLGCRIKKMCGIHDFTGKIENTGKIAYRISFPWVGFLSPSSVQ